MGLEKAMATHSSTLVWKISWMEEPGGLQGPRLLAHPCSGMTLGSPLAGQRSSPVPGALGKAGLAMGTWQSG